MAPTVQQFPQPASGFFSLPAVPPTAAHLLDRSIGFTTANSSNSSGIPPLQFPLGFPSVVSGFQIPSKVRLKSCFIWIPFMMITLNSGADVVITFLYGSVVVFRRMFVIIV